KTSTVVILLGSVGRRIVGQLIHLTDFARHLVQGHLISVIQVQIVVQGHATAAAEGEKGQGRQQHHQTHCRHDQQLNQGEGGSPFFSTGNFADHISIRMSSLTACVAHCRKSSSD